MAKILLIDDDEQLRAILHQRLTTAGHAVTTACNGIDGLKLFRDDPADLVITDIVMPEQEGLETIVKLRRENLSLGIIAMSGGRPTSETWLKVAGLLGANRMLSKPFSTEQISKAVADVLAIQPRFATH